MAKDGKYIRFSTGFNENQLLPVNTDFYKLVQKMSKKGYYTSIYNYNSKHLEEFKKTHSVAGITDVKTNRLVFDFDSATDIELARKDAVELTKRLIESGVPEDKIRVYFSGNKGFHVDLVTNKELSRQEFVNITFRLAEGLKTFDTRINDEQRIFRLPLTRHPKTGLYKIPIGVSDLVTLNSEEIMADAKSLDGFEGVENQLKDDDYTIEMPEILAEYSTQEYKKVTASTDIETNIDIGNFDISTIDFTKCPKWMAPERYALQEGFFYGSESVTRGERNTAFMILAATYKNQGFSAEHALGLLETTAEKQARRTAESPRTSEDLRKEVVNVVYSPTWRGGIYARDEELLELTRKRFNIQSEVSHLDLVGIDNVGLDFKEFARHIDRNTVKTGLKSLDDRVLITSGMMVSLLAAPGAGKTSFANMFVEYLSGQKENTIYFSLDMYKNLLFSRFLQRHSGYDMRKILDMFKNDDPDSVLQDAYARVVESYANVYFNFKSGPTVEEIEREIISYQQEKGQEAKLIVIDYLEKIRGPFSDSTANSAYVASRLADIAKKYHTTVLLLVQPQKAAGDPRDELTSYRKIKGASVIEQDSRVILTLSRPGYDPKNVDMDKFATISVVKNNMGGLCQLDYGWNGVSGQLTELDSGQRRELKELRDQIQQAKDSDEFPIMSYEKKKIASKL